MQLTQYSDYALRTLIYLAITSENVTITEIAEHYQISRNHLVKVVHSLGKLGYITTIRGRQGGMRLALPADQIVIGEVVRKTEPGFTLVECFDRANNKCVIAPACRLQNVLGEAFLSFTDVLDRYTLEDMVGNSKELRRYLGLSTKKR
jgi:Rrf2 family transcriptional regulator, nitric oxide-sensitive transcriptional repressor